MCKNKFRILMVTLLALAEAMSCVMMPFTVMAEAESQAAAVDADAEPISPFSVGISDKLLEAIHSGQQELEVTMMYKSLDWKAIIQEVYQKGEDYKNSLDPTIYTADEINEMTGYYKEQLTDDLCSAATEEYRKSICDSLHIPMENVAFVGNSMTCTLTPEQIMTALESDWLSRKIVLRSEIVTDEDLGYEQIVAATSLKGDANCDGKVDILDVIKVNKYILGTVSLDPAGNQNADMNNNGNIEPDDSLAILKAVLGITD